MEDEKKLCRQHYISLLNLLSSYRVPQSSMDAEYSKYSSPWRYMLKLNVDFLEKELFAGAKNSAYATTYMKFYEYREKREEILRKYGKINTDPLADEELEVSKDLTGEPELVNFSEDKTEESQIVTEEAQQNSVLATEEIPAVTDKEKALSTELLALENEYKSFREQSNKDMVVEVVLSKPLYSVLPANTPVLRDQKEMDFLVDLGVVREF